MGDSTQPIATRFKDPDEVLPFTIDWAADADDGGPWLVGNDEISVSTWDVTTGITVDSDSETTTTTQIVLSGGTAGETYFAANKIVTTAGWTAVRTIQINVVER